MDNLTQTLGRPPETIAVFRAIKLGDLLCAVPALRALRSAFPNAHIALISLPWATEFVACYPQYIDEFIPFPGWPGLPEQPLHPVDTVLFLRDMQHRQWDVVIQLQGNGTLVNAMLSLFNARVLAGYYPPELPAERWAANAGLFQPYPTQAHEVVRHVELMRFLNVPAQGYELEFTTTDVERQTARQWLTQLGGPPGRVVCMHAGGVSGRRWPPADFAFVADALAELGYTIVFTGTASETLIVDSVRSMMAQPAVSIAGQTTLRQLAAIVQESALVISNDTGVAHLAVACHTRSVVVFTSADPAEWGPLDQTLHTVVPDSAPDCPRRVVAAAIALLSANDTQTAFPPPMSSQTANYNLQPNPST